MVTSRVQTLRSSTKKQRPGVGAREVGELYVNFPDLQLGVVDTTKVPQDLIAIRRFSASTDYVLGDYVVQSGQLYRAKGAVTAAAFNASQWDAILPLSGLLAVDGAGSGLDADLLDGQNGTYYLDLANATGVLPSDAAHGPRGGGSLHANATASVAGFLSPGDKSKLDSVASGATDDQTPAEILTSIKTVDGTGSGLDADLLDGQHGAFYQDASNLNAGTIPAGRINATSHGNLAGGALHAAATSSTAGFFTDANSDSKQYVRKNAAWQEVVVPPNTYVGDDPPPAPADGQMWWEADSGLLFIFFNDGNSSQWVQIPALAPVSVPPVVLTAQTRNRVVNPCFQISQEWGSAGTSVPGYPADQWYGGSNIATTSFTRHDGPTPQGNKQLGTGLSTAKPSLAAGDYWQIIQYIEGIRVKDFLWGTASARQVILRFRAYTNAPGTYTVALSGGGGQYYLAPFTLPNNAETEITIIVPGCTTGTWVTDNNLGLTLVFGLAAGTTYGGGTAGWGTTNKIQIAGNTNGAATVSTFFFREVGLYLDDQRTGVAPPWVMPDEAQELAACQRYWEKVGFLLFGTVPPYPYGHYMVTKRTTPALSALVASAGTGGNIVTSGTVVGLITTFWQSNSHSSPAEATFVANARM